MTSLEVVDWDGLIDRDHLVRRILKVLDQLNLSKSYDKINSQKDYQGRLHRDDAGGRVAQRLFTLLFIIFTLLLSTVWLIVVA